MGLVQLACLGPVTHLFPRESTHWPQNGCRLAEAGVHPKRWQQGSILEGSLTPISLLLFVLYKTRMYRDITKVLHIGYGLIEFVLWDLFCDSLGAYRIRFMGLVLRYRRGRVGAPNSHHPSPVCAVDLLMKISNAFFISCQRLEDSSSSASSPVGSSTVLGETVHW